MDGWTDGRMDGFICLTCFEKQNKKEKPFAVFYHVLFYSFQFNSLVSFIDLLKMHQIVHFQFPPLISFLDLFRRHFAIQYQLFRINSKSRSKLLLTTTNIVLLVRLLRPCSASSSFCVFLVPLLLRLFLAVIVPGSVFSSPS